MQKLAEACERIAGTTKKLEKIAIVAEYLKSRTPDEAAVSAVFLSGRTFPLWEETTLQVGGSLLWRMVAELSGKSETELTAAYRRHGDLGAVAGEVLPATSRCLNVLDVQQRFRQIAGARGPAAKGMMVRELLSLSAPLEAKYIVKIVTGDLRIGLKESLVEEAIQENAHFRSRKGRTNARMRTAAKCQMLLSLLAPELEFVRVLPAARIPVRGRQRNDQSLAGCDFPASDPGFPAGHAKGHLRRSLKPQDLLDEGRSLGAILAKLLLQSRILRQEAQAIPYQFGARILAGGKQEHRQPNSLRQVGRRAIWELGSRKLRQHIGPRVCAPILDVADEMSRQMLENRIRMRPVLGIDITGGRTRSDHLSKGLAVIRGDAEQIGDHQSDVGYSYVLDELAFSFGNHLSHGPVGEVLHVGLVCLQT